MSLSTNTLLASVQFQTLGNSRKDPRLTSEVHERHGMSSKAGRYQRSLLPEECFKPLQAVSRACRSNHDQLTLLTPLGCLLPAVKAAEYTHTMEKWRHSWDAAVRRFIADYDKNIDLARIAHNGTFDLTLYPSHAELPAKFDFKFSLIPLPRPEMLDELTGLADAQVHELRRQLAENTAASADAAKAEVMQRILFRLRRLSECLGNEDGRLRERTVDSLTELLDMAPAYNLTGDPAITRLVADCRANLTLATEVLRNNPAARSHTAAAARVILTTAARRVA